MEGVTFSETEQRVFAELFSSIDTENNGRISGSKALELLRRSSLPSDDIQKVIELCGATRLGHFGRSQFYLALKLVAAAQSGCTLNQETFKGQTCPQSIPLPKFGGNNNSSGVILDSSCPPNLKSKPLSSSPSSPSSGNNNKNNGTTPHLIPPPVSSKMSPRSRNGSNFNKGSPSHLKSLTPSSSPEPGSSPRALADQGWQSFVDEKDEKWTNSEEGCRLIEGEDDEEEDASDATDDEEGSFIDVFAVSDDQKEYYVKQFLSIQSNPQGKITGTSAKDFFERSKLSANDLSRIWHLADVDQDGALSLEEFCIAMHLVVLRRNSVELPSSLPSCLRSLVFDKKDRKEPQVVSPLIPLTPSPTNTATIPTDHQLSQGPKTGLLINITKPLIECNGVFGDNSNWTKFSDSPTPRSEPFFGGPVKQLNSLPVQTSTATTIHSSSLQDQSVSSSNSSLAAAPANFDFNASCIESDPKILHPIPLRLTPDGQAMLKSLAEDPSSLSQSSLLSLAPPPPPPPPRLNRSVSGHARSSSLDLNRMGRSPGEESSFRSHRSIQPHSLSNFCVIPSPTSLLSSSSLATGSSHPNALNVDPSSGGLNHGAFTVYRRRNNTLPDAGSVSSFKSGYHSSSSSFVPMTPATGSQRSVDETLSLLRSKFSLPQESFIPCDPNDSKELLRCLKGLSERNLRLEKLNEKLIHELAAALTCGQRLDSFLSHLSLKDQE